MARTKTPRLHFGTPVQPRRDAKASSTGRATRPNFSGRTASLNFAREIRRPEWRVRFLLARDVKLLCTVRWCEVRVGHFFYSIFL